MRIARYLPLLLLLVPTLPGCQPASEQENAMEPDRTPMQINTDFENLRGDWQRMANAGDAMGVADLYTEDAVLTDPAGNVYTGRQAIEGYLEQAFPSQSDINIQTTGRWIHEDVVAAYGTFSVTMTGPDGDTPMSGMWQTVGSYQPDGTLKIQLHQDMVPVETPEGSEGSEGSMG